MGIHNLIAFGAENAIINYEIHKPIFVNLKNENDLIIKANCLCHVIHNNGKYVLMKFPLDVQN